eukprot:TRINITY_DN3713_c0_g1_i1.p1 TRINITY_DN3713_c0_g1~~TRINITY_DN3713_c0_g1_i1.p1  ORF type:complete len:755 (+),score=231.09 TRINITY_DN3713_c0_g1_i1:72-2267(+)
MRARRTARRCGRQRRYCSGAAGLRAGAAGLRAVEAALADAAVGHATAKEALVLALAAKEHVYFEGPPGTAKSQLARAAAQAAGLGCFDTQLHRDTRASHLVGDPVLLRLAGAGGGEQLRFSSADGGMLGCGVAVLDDISRAPGEALNVLLRVLAERRWKGLPLPLCTAVATGNPTEGEGYANEALDPAALDRFLLQVRVEGMLPRGDEAGARALLQQAAGTEGPPGPVRAAPEHLAAAHAALPLVALTPRVRDLLLKVLSRIAAAVARQPRGGAGRPWVGVTDRSFLVKAPKVLRARALLHGRSKCEPADLAALSLMTAFRIPPDVPLEDIIQEAMEGERAGSSKGDQRQPRSADERPDFGDDDDLWYLGGDERGEQDGAEEGQGNAKAARGDDAGGSGGDQGEEQEGGGHKGSGSEADAEGQQGAGSEAEGTAGGEGSGGGHSGLQSSAHRSGGVPQRPAGQSLPGDPAAGEDADGAPGDGDSGTRGQGRGPGWDWGVDLPKGDSRLDGPEPPSLAAQTRGDVAALMASLAGRFQRCDARRELDRAGGPRTWRRMRSFDDISEADAGDLAEWARDPTMALPRVAERKRRQGGAVVVLRDVSYSMQGVKAAWAACVASGVAELAQRRGMRIGYAEFSDSPRRGELTEVPLVQCARRHVLFLTDGEPTAGCPHLRGERALARRCNVQVHTVYISDGDGDRPPPVLSSLSAETGGAGYRATHECGNVIRITAC